MASELAIPVLDQTTERVALTHWLKREGDRVVPAARFLEQLKRELEAQG